MGREGLDTLLPVLHEVYDLHLYCREYLEGIVEGYVFDRNSGDMQIILSKDCNMDKLRERLKSYEKHGVGIMKLPPQIIQRIEDEYGVENASDKEQVYININKLKRCA